VGEVRPETAVSPASARAMVPPMLVIMLQCASSPWWLTCPRAPTAWRVNEQPERFLALNIDSIVSSGDICSGRVAEKSFGHRAGHVSHLLPCIGTRKYGDRKALTGPLESRREERLLNVPVSTLYLLRPF
jgi:hypothetical protein